MLTIALSIFILVIYMVKFDLFSDGQMIGLNLSKKCQKYAANLTVYLLQPLCKGSIVRTDKKGEHRSHSRLPLNCILCLRSCFHGRMQPERDLKHSLSNY